MYQGRKVGAFLDRVCVAFCEPKTSTATTRGQKAHLALGSHYIFCNTSIVFRVFFTKNDAYVAVFIYDNYIFMKIYITIIIQFFFFFVQKIVY